MADAQTRPRFRSDLVATPLEVEGQRFIDVTDPDSEQTFRFYEVEYSVACAMDGARDVVGLVQWSKEELGLEPTRDEVQTVIDTLADLGYLMADVDGGIELGSAGPAARRAAAPPPAADDIELGLPGAAVGGTPRPASPARPADIELGESGRAPAVPAGKVTMGWDAVSPPPAMPTKPKLPQMPTAPPGVGKVTMGWDAPPVDPKELEALLGAKPSAGASGNVSIDADVPAPPEPASPVPTLRPRGRPEESGPTQIPSPVADEDAYESEAYDEEDVSVDLSDHLSIGKEDVKEAVRQSKTMDAVKVPDDLAAEFDEEPPTRPAPDEQVAALAARSAQPAREIEREASKPVPLPEKPPKVTAPAAAEAPDERPAPKSGGMGLVVFVILVLALGGAGYWYFMIYKQDAAPAKTPRPTPGTSAVVKPPVRVAARLAAAAPASTEIKAPTAGVIETIGLAGDEVAEGAVVAQYKGVAAVERSLSRPRRKLMEYSEALEQAKAGGNAKLVDMYQKKVDEKAKLVEEGEAQLDRLLVLSPVAGKVEPVVDAGATVAEGAVIARVVGGPGLQATLPAGSRKLAVGDACELASAKNPGVKAVCKVSAVAGGQVTAWIAGDAGFAAGDEVVLQ